MNLHYHTPDGLQFAVRPNSTDVSIIKEVAERDAYLVRDYLKPGMIAIDIGGHIGSFSVFAASLGAKVWVCEPAQASFDLLMQNREVNGFEEMIRPHNVGIMDHNGQETLHIRQRNFGGTGFFTEGALTEQVQVMTLDFIFSSIEEKRCDFLKLDCEDSELLILKSFSHLDKVRRIAVEYVGAERRDDIIALLTDRFAHAVIGNDTMGIIHLEARS